MKIPKKRHDDYYGVAAIGLCEAAIEYTNRNLQTEIPFVRFARVIIKHKIIDEFRAENALKRTCETANIDDEEISSSYSLEDEVVGKDVLVEILSELIPLHKEIMVRLYDGCSCKEIAERFNLSHDNVRRIKGVIKKKVSEVMARND